MSQLGERLSVDECEALKAIANRASVICACGRPKAQKHNYCLHCSKWFAGPYVIVESPSGNYVELGGLESPAHFAERNYGL